MDLANEPVVDRHIQYYNSINSGTINKQRYREFIQHYKIIFNAKPEDLGLHGLLQLAQGVHIAELCCIQLEQNI